MQRYAAAGGRAAQVVAGGVSPSAGPGQLCARLRLIRGVAGHRTDQGCCDGAAFSVRFALLPEEEQRASWPATAGPFRALASVQLRARHWVMREAAGDVTDEVRGEAVVGEYPILTPGAPGARAPCAALRRVPLHA